MPKQQTISDVVNTKLNMPSTQIHLRNFCALMALAVALSLPERMALFILCVGLVMACSLLAAIFQRHAGGGGVKQIVIGAIMCFGLGLFFGWKNFSG